MITILPLSLAVNGSDGDFVYSQRKIILFSFDMNHNHPVPIGDKLRIAVALSALRVKPPDESVQSFVARLRTSFANTDASDASKWKERAAQLERELKELQGRYDGELGTVVGALKRKKKGTRNKEKDVRDFSDFIRSSEAQGSDAQSTSVRLVRGLGGPSLLQNIHGVYSILTDILKGNPDPSDALVDTVLDNILYPLIPTFYTTSRAIIATKQTVEDSRMDVLDVLRNTVTLLPQIREAVGLAAARELLVLYTPTSPSTSAQDLPARIFRRLARKEAVWYLCSLLHSLFPSEFTASSVQGAESTHEPLLASAISDTLSKIVLKVKARDSSEPGPIPGSRDDIPDQVELGTILAAVESYWTWSRLARKGPEVK